MKKILAIILVLCTLCLSSCGALTKGIAVEQSKEYTKIILDNFEGKKKIDIPTIVQMKVACIIALILQAAA